MQRGRRRNAKRPACRITHGPHQYGKIYRTFTGDVENPPGANYGLDVKRTFDQFLLWTLIVLAGSGYGLLGYGIFSSMFSHGRNAGVMTLSFLLGIPFSGSATVAYAVTYTRNATVSRAIKVAILVIFAAIALSVPIYGEGSICILMFVGMMILPCLAGAVLGFLIAELQRSLSRQTMMSVVVLLPFALGALEQSYTPPDAVHELHRSISISAAPEKVWSAIMHPENIRPDELKGGAAFEIGAPYPMDAEVIRPEVGGIRKSRWQRGVSFDEEITAIEPNRYVEWIYHFDKDSFPPGSLDDHVKIGGTYFDLKNTSYRLSPEDNGTRLEISVRYRVTTNFNWYAVPWANFFVGNTAETLLRFYKNRAERGAT